MNMAVYCHVSTAKVDQLNSLEAEKESFGEYIKVQDKNLARINFHLW